MHRVFSMCLDAAIAAIILIPVFIVLNRHFFRNRKRTVCYTLFAVYLCGMFAVVGLPDIRYVRFDPNYNLTPFAYMFSDSTNSLLNVLLFVPMGLCLPLFWIPCSILVRTLFIGFSVSLLIEVLQIFTYRASDINDLMTNTFGTLIGWAIARLLLRCFPSISPHGKTVEFYVVGLTAFVVMFFLQPFLADFLFSII